MKKKCFLYASSRASVFLKLKKIVLSVFVILPLFYFSSCSLLIGAEEVPQDESGPIVVDRFPMGNKTDVLMLFYMDGDNNLAQAIWQDLNEIEYGLYLAEKYSAVSAKVDIFVLWDGDEYGDTRLYKIGADDRINSSGAISLRLSNSTLDLTIEAASWLRTTEGKYEVSMSNPETVENFLRWACDHYIIDDDTQVILQFANHGGGPRSMGASRAMCQDEHTVGSNNQQLLWTKDIPQSINSSGILRNKNKIDIVIQDVCNGANIEEAYEYRDVADYMLLSPNEMPGYGLNYVDLISHLRAGDCIENGKLDVEKFLDKAVCGFINFYKGRTDWAAEKNKLAIKNSTLPANEQLSDEELNLKASLFYKNVATITAVKLADINILKDDINMLAELLNRPSNKFTHTDRESGETKSYKYLNTLQSLVFLNMRSYSTLYADLYDIGDFANNIIGFNRFNKSGCQDIEDAAFKIRKDLDSVILYSWHDGVGGALYNKSSRSDLKGLGLFNTGSYGLAISGLVINRNKFTGEPIGVSFDGKNYNSQLQFGKDAPNWCEFINGVIDSNKRFN